MGGADGESYLVHLGRVYISIRYLVFDNSSPGPRKKNQVGVRYSNNSKFEKVTLVLLGRFLRGLVSFSRVAFGSFCPFDAAFSLYCFRRFWKELVSIIKKQL